MAASDSCLTGCGSFSEGKFFHTIVPDFILKQNLHNYCLELLAIMVTNIGEVRKLYCTRTIKTLAGPLIPVNREKFVFMQRSGNFKFALKKFLEVLRNRIPDNLSKWHDIPKYTELFYSSEAKLNVNLTEYFVTENCFRFTNR